MYHWPSEDQLKQEHQSLSSLLQDKPVHHVSSFLTYVPPQSQPFAPGAAEVAKQEAEYTSAFAKALGKAIKQNKLPSAVVPPTRLLRPSRLECRTSGHASGMKPDHLLTCLQHPPGHAQKKPADWKTLGELLLQLAQRCLGKLSRARSLLQGLRITIWP